jgi:shikimate dehydrogenase
MNAPAGPDRYAVLGNPVAHSRSPFIHAAFAEQTGQAMRYDRVLCPLEDFAGHLQAFAACGARGCNITVPFKQQAFALASRHSPRAALAGAANTLRREAEGWWADNTDGVGLVRDIELGAGVPLAGLRVLLLGAGGAAAGVLGPLLAARPAAVAVVNRTAHKARALAVSHTEWARGHGAALWAGGLDDPTLTEQPFDCVLNATASSLQGAAAPVSARALAPGALAVDLMYGPAAAPFLAWAEAAGARPRDGLGMLVEQAAEAFYAWRGMRPQTAPVLKALRIAMSATP